METLICSQCSATIPAANINVATDLAQCPQCHHIEKVSALVLQSEKEQAKNPPPGTKITLTKARHETMLTLPAKGVGFTTIFGSVFALFWIGFVAVWTVLSFTASPWFSLFSIPFWFAGFAIISSVINSVFEKQRLIVNQKGLVLEKIRPIRPKHIEIPFSELKVIAAVPIKKNNQAKSRSQVEESTTIPAIVTAQKPIHFFEHATEAEQEWVVHLLTALVQQQKLETSRIHI